MILTYGSRGDVQPFIALGAALRERGHAVRLAAPAPFGPLIQRHGLGFEAIPGDPDELARSFADRAGLNWPLMVVRMIQHVMPLAQAAMQSVANAARDADLIVHGFLMTEAGHTLARSRGVPDVSAQFFPVFVPTSAFPSVALPDLPLGGAYRRATHALNTAVFRYGGRLLYRRIRASAPGLPDLAPWPFSDTARGTTPILFAYSRHVLPRPAEWPPYAHVTGFWQLPPSPGWEPAPALVRFLDSGPPPVYFGPGSVRTERVQDLLRMVITSVRSFGQRLLLGVAPQAVEGEWRGDDVYSEEGSPHAWLFPRMRYILHHGGAGTTGSAAAAGVPSSAIPFYADQSFWARRLQDLGVGPAAPPGRRLTRRRLEAMLRELLTNPNYRRRAGSLGELIGREGGLDSAVQVIEGRLPP